MKIIHYIGRLPADRILYADHRSQPAAQSKIQKRAVSGKIVKFLLLPLRQSTFFIFKDKMITADQRPPAVNGRGDPMGNDILDRGVSLLVDQPFPRRLLHNRIGDRMGEVLFQAGRHGASRPRLYFQTESLP